MVARRFAACATRKNDSSQFAFVPIVDKAGQSEKVELQRNAFVLPARSLVPLSGAQPELSQGVQRYIHSS